MELQIMNQQQTAHSKSKLTITHNTELELVLLQVGKRKSKRT